MIDAHSFFQYLSHYLQHRRRTILLIDQHQGSRINKLNSLFLKFSCQVVFGTNESRLGLYLSL